MGRAWWVRPWGSFALLGIFLLSCGGPPPGPTPDPDPTDTAAVFRIVSPTDGSPVSTATFFAVQVLDGAALESVELYVDGDLVAPTFPGETPTRVFLVPADHPVGPLALEARVRSGGVEHRRSIEVQVVRVPPASASVGADGAVVGDVEENGSVSAVTIPAGVAAGASVQFETLTKDEVLAQTGVDYDGLGVTFLGAQEIRSSEPTGDGVAMTSGGFGPQVQSTHTVVSYRIMDDAGRGVGELMVINGASLAPNGDVVSNPPVVPQAGVALATSALGTVALAVHDGGALRTAANLPGGPPGSFLEVPVSGLNIYAVDGYYVRFRVGATTATAPATVGLNGDGSQYLFAVVPALPAGAATVDLVWRAADTVIGSYAMNVTAAPSAPASPKAVVDANFAALLAALDEAEADFLAEGIALPFGPVRAKVTAMQAELAALAADHPRVLALARSLVADGLVASATEIGAIGTSNSAACFLNSLKYTTDKELARRAFRGDQSEVGLKGLTGNLTVAYLDRFADRLQDSPQYDCDPYKKFLCEEMGNCDGEDEVVEEPWDDDVPNDPLPRPWRVPDAYRSAPRNWITGMGSATWSGGPVGGAFRDDAAGGSALSASTGGIAPASVTPGRYVVRATVNGLPLPFAAGVGEDGYFFLPLMPAGQANQLVITDLDTGRECIQDVDGRPVGSATAVYVDFATCAGDPVDPGEYTILWIGDVDQNWSDARNWEPERVPDAEDDVWIPGSATEVVLPSGFEFQPPQVVQVNSLRSQGTVVFGNTTLQTTGDVHLGVYRLDFPGPTTLQIGGTFTYDGVYVGVPSGFTLPGGDVTLETVTVTSRLTVPGTLTVTDRLALLANGALTGAGTTILPVGAVGRVDVSPLTPLRAGTVDGHTLEVRGTLTLAEGQELDGTSLGLFNGGVLRVAPGGVLRMSGNTVVTGSGGGTLVNEGRVEIEAPVAAPATDVLVFTGVTLDNRAVVEVATDASLAFDGILRNAATGTLTGGGTTSIDAGGVAEFTGGAITGGHTLVNQAGAIGGGGTTWVATGAAPLTLAAGAEIVNAPNPFNATLSTFAVANDQPLSGGGTFRNQANLTKTAGTTSDWSGVCYVQEGAGQLTGAITVGSCPP